MNSSPSRNLHVFGAILDWLAVRAAILGGIIIAVLAGVTVTSIIGRTFFNHAILGDFEITEIGLAIAVFLFLPYCLLKRGNVVIDFFTIAASDRTKAILDGIGNLVFALIAALLIWRLYLGGLEKYTYNEGSMLLDIKTWWAYVVIVPATGLLFLSCIYNLLCDIRAVLSSSSVTGSQP